MYDIEKLYLAKSVADAISALQEDESAVVICGGSDVLIKIREGKLAGCSLVSIHDLPELSVISMGEDGEIRIGPAVTFAKITKNALIQRLLPALGDAVDQAGGPQLRNTGTIGGNVCNGVTSADSAATLLTLNAELELTGPDGVRRVPLESFYKGPGRVDLAHAELLTAICVAKRNYEGFGGHYIKYAQRSAMDIATLGCAACVRMEDGKIAELRLAFGVAAPTPVRCRETEELARGKAPTEELLRALGEHACSQVNPRTSWRASKEFRLQLVKELTGRAVKQAILNAGGGANA